MANIVRSSIEGVRPRRGRPRKFTAPSRAVTLTLPETVLAALEGLDLQIQDALDAGRLPAEDARVFEAIADILKSARRSGSVTLIQRNIIVLESSRPARHRLQPPIPKRRR